MSLYYYIFLNLDFFFILHVDFSEFVLYLTSNSKIIKLLIALLIMLSNFISKLGCTRFKISYLKFKIWMCHICLNSPKMPRMYKNFVSILKSNTYVLQESSNSSETLKMHKKKLYLDFKIHTCLKNFPS